MSHKLTCNISGKSITVGNEYFDKKVTVFGSPERVHELYVSQQNKNLLNRGYKIKDICNLLKIEQPFNPNFTDKTVKELLTIKEESDNKTNISTKKSDQEVIDYIENLKSI